MFVGYISERPGIHSGAPYVSLGSFRFVGVIQARPGDRRVHSCSLVSFVRALGVFGFIRARALGRRVYLDSFGPVGRALEVIGFSWVRCVHSGVPWGFVGFIRARPVCRWVHSGARPCSQLGSLGSFWRALWVVEFIPVHWFHSAVSMGSLGSFGLVGFIRPSPCGRWVHLCLFGHALVVVGLIRARHWVHSGVPWQWSGSFEFVWFIWVRPWGVRWVHWGALLGSFGFVGFIRAHPGCRLEHSRALCV